jgi:hypothetical protein
MAISQKVLKIEGFSYFIEFFFGKLDKIFINYSIEL